MGSHPAQEFSESRLSRSAAQIDKTIPAGHRFSRKSPAPAGLCLLLIFFLPAGLTAQTDTELRFYAEQIRSGDIEARRDALYALRNFQSERASQTAAPALRDPADIVRATAARTVIYLAADRAAQLLAPLLGDPSEFVRREAAHAAGETGSRQTVPRLLELLRKDRSRAVRAAAAAALGRIGDPAAVADLTRILQKKPRKKEEFLRRAAARSIGRIAEMMQTGRIPETTPEDFLPDKHPPPAARYRDLTGSQPVFRPAVETLIRTLENPREYPDVKREATFALGATAAERAVPALQKQLGAEDYYLAEITREALGKISAAKKTRDEISRPETGRFSGSPVSNLPGFLF